MESEEMEDNPWNVENLEEFLYFCCPECDLKDQSKTEFLQHALEQHPKAKDCVQQFNEFIIKDEPSFEEDFEEEDNENCDSEIFEDSNMFPEIFENPNIENAHEILKCEIKVEPNDQELIS